MEVSVSPWPILIAAIAVQVAVSAIAQAYPTLAPYIRADLGLSLAAVGLVNTYIYVGTMLGAVPAGWVTDRLGSRKVLMGGALLCGLMALLIPWLSRSPLWFEVFLFTLGLLVATATPAGSQAVAQVFPPERRGLAIGLRQMGVPLGGALAAALLPWVASQLGWRWASAAAAVVAAVAAAMVVWLYREAPPPPTKTPGQRGPSLLAVLRERNVLLAASAGVTLPTGQFIMLTYLILFLKDRFGVPELQGALWLAAANLIGAFSRVFWSALSDRLAAQRKPLLVLVVGLSGLSALLMALLPVNTPLGWVNAVVLLFGACALGWQGLHFSLLSELSPKGWEGRVTGFGLLFTSIGIASAPPLFGWVVDVFGSFSLAWALLSVVYAVGAVLLWQVREKPRA